MTTNGKLTGLNRNKTRTCNRRHARIDTTHIMRQIRKCSVTPALIVHTAASALILPRLYHCYKRDGGADYKLKHLLNISASLENHMDTGTFRQHGLQTEVS